jgi:hypothetical protein
LKQLVYKIFDNPNTQVPDKNSLHLFVWISSVLGYLCNYGTFPNVSGKNGFWLLTKVNHTCIAGRDSCKG